MHGLSWLDIGLMGAYFGLVTIIGIASARAVSTQGDFYVGGRRLGKFLTIMMSFGVGTSNTHPILVSGAVYKLGMPGIWYSWLYMLFMPAQWVLEPLIRRLRIYTTADYFELRYSKGLGPCFSLSAMFNIGIMIGTMLIGMGQIVEGITAGGLTSDVVIVLAAVVIVLYGTAGGLLAAALTDVLQGFLVILLSFMLLPPMFNAVGGLEGLHAALPAERFSLAMPRGGDPSQSIGVFAIFMLFINGVMGSLIEPQAQTKQASKDEWTLRIGVLIGTFLKRLCTVAWALVGLCAVVIWPSLDNAETCFGLATREYLPSGFSGLMIAAMMAAAMSTCDALMVSGSAIFSRNLYARYIHKSATDRHYLTVARCVGVLLVGAGLIIAFWLGSVIEAVELWWKVTAFIGPTLLLGMFFRRGNSWGAWACVIVSATVWALTQYDVIVSSADLRWDTVWYQAALYLPAGIAAYFMVSLLTLPENGAKLDRFFARLNTPVGEEEALIATG
ncbi:MAG TPA: sodium:solute symporter family protein [Phycisphaerae bacterium]|nr:sodium:solute symporter family protein [Phycisphaerae bacterium]